ncbi:MAG: FimB/Mfa2 family fimbrial subunit, partial [Muribaculaceae bacterium]|nr:FimB/Mfa2 family fimbrial subunit [Muribaculaceae bacterium]
MKKIIYSAMAVAMLATTSCKDDFAESFVGEEATVEFSISTADMNTRAFSEGEQVDHLHYAIYEEDGTITQLTAKNVDFKDRQETLRLNLKTGKTYKAIFWADDENAPYDIDFNAKTMKIALNSDYMKSNNDMLDAFYAVEEINVSQSATKNVVLTRPFAQINVGTNDWTESVNANYRPTQSSMSVPVYTTLNLWNGSVEDRYQVEYAYNDLPTEALEVNGQNYTYIAMNYVLVDERETIDVTFKHKDAKGVETSKTVGSVPVQRNFRTNLYGSLLTSQQEVNITINPAFGGVENKEIVEVATADDLQTAIANPNVGQVVLTSDIEMSDILVIGAPSNNPAPTRSGAVAASRNLVIDGNGKTLKSNAARAINVSGVDGVTIKNLNIITSGERAINIIQNATNVTIEDVTATAANYTVNVAASAPKA